MKSPSSDEKSVKATSDRKEGFREASEERESSEASLTSSLTWKTEALKWQLTAGPNVSRHRAATFKEGRGGGRLMEVGVNYVRQIIRGKNIYL